MSCGHKTQSVPRLQSVHRRRWRTHHREDAVVYENTHVKRGNVKKVFDYDYKNVLLCRKLFKLYDFWFFVQIHYQKNNSDRNRMTCITQEAVVRRVFYVIFTNHLDTCSLSLWYLSYRFHVLHFLTRSRDCSHTRLLTLMSCNKAETTKQLVGVSTGRDSWRIWS